MNKKLYWQIPLALLLIIGTIYIARQEHSKTYRHAEGSIFGTIYHITYEADRDLQPDMVEALMRVDNSLSMFNDSSVISRINRGEDVDLGKQRMFVEVFQLAQTISKETNGAFDITVAPLVNAWGFGFKNDTKPSPAAIDSLRQFIGYQNVNIVNHQVQKTDPRTMLDCSAIAKGYGTDVVARLLRSKDVNNFMIEIGGEVVVAGKNDRGGPWRIGVTKPTEDPENQNNELQAVLSLPYHNSTSTSKHTLSALATSGNYRNFYYKDGKRYAHTIDPRTGYPVQHNILSATVIAPNCATADAYATSFMVLGLDSAKQVLAHHPELLAYLIYTDEKGQNATWQSDQLLIDMQ
jgi:thiamine biosynthesis lipoprotein